MLMYLKAWRMGSNKTSQAQCRPLKSMLTHPQAWRMSSIRILLAPQACRMSSTRILAARPWRLRSTRMLAPMESGHSASVTVAPLSVPVSEDVWFYDEDEWKV